MKKAKRWLALILAVTLVSSNALYQIGTTLSADEVEEIVVEQPEEKEAEPEIVEDTGKAEVSVVERDAADTNPEEINSAANESGKPGNSDIKNQNSVIQDTGGSQSTESEGPKTENSETSKDAEEGQPFESEEPETENSETPKDAEEKPSTESEGAEEPKTENSETPENATEKPSPEEKVPSDEEQLSDELLLSDEAMLLEVDDQATPANTKEIYVSSGGDDANNGSQETPYATLTKAVAVASDGATIYVMSDLTMSECARYFDKSLTITSSEGAPYTITRGDNFKPQNDSGRSWYNPAMIEVQSSKAESVGLTLSNIILDDNAKHEGTIFAQAVNGSDNNKDYVQDAIIASNAEVPCTITLGDGAVLRNYGGMSAVRATAKAKIVMESGSVIEDTKDSTRTKEAAGSVGSAGAVWIQGGTFVMEKGSAIQNVNGRAIYADGGAVEVGGTISGIVANKSVMWQGDNGIAIHLRNGAEGTLTTTALINKITGGSMIYCADGAKAFRMESGSKITDCPYLKANVIYAQNCTVELNGEISNVNAAENHILQTAGGTTVIIGENGQIINNHANYGTVYINGTDEQLDIYGKINNNICTDRCGGVALSNNGTNYNATMHKGAEICNNRCEQTGGGIMVSKGTFTMNGGTISGNISGTDSSKNEVNWIGGGVFVRRGGQFIMNGGIIEDNAATGFGGGICFDASDYSGMVPKAELNGGIIRNNRMQVNVDGEYQITGGASNDLAITGKDYGKSDRYLSVSDEMTIGNKAVYFQSDNKSITPADTSLDIKLGNTSEQNVTSLTNISQSMGWSDPLASFWAQRGGAATLTVDGLNPDRDLPVYVLALPVNANGTINSAAKEQVYTARKTGEGTVSLTLPDISGDGYAVALVQPSQDYGTLTISGPETIRRNQTGEDYSVTYTVTYDLSESMEQIIEQSANSVSYDLTIAQDNRLAGTPGNFDGKSIEVTYRLPNSDFASGSLLLTSAKLTITVDRKTYTVLSNVAETQMLELTYDLTTRVNGGHGTISAGKTGLAAGSKETVTFTPDTGYEIDTVTVNGMDAEVSSDTLDVIMDADKTVIVTYKEIPHTHIFDQEIQKPEALKTAADCTHDAVYYKSCVCGEISTEETFTATDTKLGHDWSTNWSTDADNHWHECSRCHAISETGAHTFVWEIVRPATKHKRGLRHEVCSVCGYQRMEETFARNHHSGGGSSSDDGNQTNPVTPVNPDIPVTPVTPNTNTLSVTPITDFTDTVVTPTNENGQESPADVQETDNDADTEEILQDEDEEVPLAGQKLDGHKYCILHFLIILLALILGILETRSIKKREKKLQEMEDKLG